MSSIILLDEQDWQNIITSFFDNGGSLTSLPLKSDNYMATYDFETNGVEVDTVKDKEHPDGD